MQIRRREFLQGALASAASLSSGASLFGCSPAWHAGEVAHLLPIVDDGRIRVKVSFTEPRPQTPVLLVAGRAFPGQVNDSSGHFFTFDARELEAATEYELRLVDASGNALCDPWPLRTFPAPDSMPRRFRLLAYTCAGGSDLLRIVANAWSQLPPRFRDRLPANGALFQPLEVRRRLLARGLSFGPDAAIANGDHIYWDLKSGMMAGFFPQALDVVGEFEREVPVLGTDNESVMKRAFGPQIADLYGTLFRSVPIFFLRDDHDYTENDEGREDLRTFPPDRFMRDVARATQRLYYPELLASRRIPRAVQSPGEICESFGELRFGRLFEALLYDCRGHLTNDADPQTGDTWSAFVPPAVEVWLLRRTQRGRTLHLAHAPSTPILWTAGKWGEWYPDIHDASGTMSIVEPKPYWPRGWKDQHDRLLRNASARLDRTPLWLSGDLHATAMGRILRTGDSSLEANPVVSVLSGTPGTAGGWPSMARDQLPVPSLTLEAEQWVEPVEENGFSLLDFDSDGLRISQFRWTPDAGLKAIDTLEPFAVRELPRPSAG